MKNIVKYIVFACVITIFYYFYNMYVPKNIFYFLALPITFIIYWFISKIFDKKQRSDN
ncbi:hypothetical protein NC3_02880 [Bacillus altitudinis]|uniref:Uncharacterized protein n=1 Tax=Bacillus aerius TaxID=293388 RepID=A0ABR6B5V9_9BACI|nr:hypothetical protein [Bacillus aerius]BDC57328.1 hypothetical protein NC3_02880 [Bacillus altitudinis]